MKPFFILSTLILFLLTSCKKEETILVAAGKTTLTFDAKVGSADFALNKNFTINTDTFQFSQLRYWVSNIVLTREDGSTYADKDSYYLIEETNAVTIQDGDYTYPARKREAIDLSNIPAGRYQSVTFSIGIDQPHNDNLSLQAGELSQLSGMTNISWMWHTSYIFSSLKGTYKPAGASAATAIKVETGLNSNYKTVTLPAAFAVDGINSSSIGINVDVTSITAGLNLKTTPTVSASTATEMAVVAGNYQNKVFSTAATR